MRKVLFACSEVYPLIKTGGLADIAGSLPAVLCSMKQDVRIILPAYPSVWKHLGKTRCMARIHLPQGEARIILATIPDTLVKIWLVDFPPYFDRPGNPYTDRNANPWPDNAERFAFFCRIIVEIAMQRTRLKWKPDIVHCHDWQTGLVPALLTLEKSPPPTVFTIHNLAYQGLFPYETFVSLNLPDHFWSYKKLEFHGQLSFIKGGLVFANQITTVSPTYATEIQTQEFGYGLQGLLQYRSDKLTGILNGIDVDTWNPETDMLIVEQYSARNRGKKKSNKRALQKLFGLPMKDDVALLGLIGRMVYQKGIDIILKSMDDLVKKSLQLIILGTGQPEYEQALTSFAETCPQQVAVNIGYNEKLAHQIEAGADIFLMPSRFEPCGLNQIYSLRYGTLPIVRHVGGLADTVIDATERNISSSTANGFVFRGEQPEDLLQTVDRALELYTDESLWKRLQFTGMLHDYSWGRSAEKYIQLYNSTETERH